MTLDQVVSITEIDEPAPHPAKPFDANTAAAVDPLDMPVAVSARRASPLAHVQEPGGGFTRKGVDGPPLVTHPDGDRYRRGRNTGDVRLVEYTSAKSYADLIVDTREAETEACREVVHGIGHDAGLINDARDYAARNDLTERPGKFAGNDLVDRAREMARQSRRMLRSDAVHEAQRLATLERRDYLLACLRGIEAGADIEHDSELVKRFGLDVAEPAPLIAYSRASKLAEGISEKGAIHRWDHRKIVEGIGLNPTLTARAMELAGAPNIGEPDWNREADVIAGLARKVSKADRASTQGTHAHALTEDFDLNGDWLARAEAGIDLGVGIHGATAAVAAWKEMCDRYGFEQLLVEARVVNDHYKIAGSADRYIRFTRDITFPMHDGTEITVPADTVAVGDLKTGRMTLNRSGYPAYWNPYAVQFAGYGYKSAQYDTATGVRTGWPWPLSEDFAVLFHLDILEAMEDNATCTPYLVDLRVGRAAADLVIAAQQFAESTLAISKAPGSSGSSGQSTAAALSASVTPTLLDSSTCADAHNVNTVRARLNTLQSRGRQWAIQIRVEWPNGVPMSFTAHQHTVQEVRALTELCDRLESAADTAGHAAVPTKRRHRKIESISVAREARAATLPEHTAPVDPASVAAQPAPVGHSDHVTDEGIIIDDATAAVVAKHFKALDKPAAKWMGRLIRDASNAGLSFRFREYADPEDTRRFTLRRFEINRGLIALAQSDTHLPDINNDGDVSASAQFNTVRALATTVTGDNHNPDDVTAGAAVGSLTASQAAQFAALATDHVAKATPIASQPGQ